MWAEEVTKGFPFLLNEIHCSGICPLAKRGRRIPDIFSDCCLRPEKALQGGHGTRYIPTHPTIWKDMNLHFIQINSTTPSPCNMPSRSSIC